MIYLYTKRSSDSGETVGKPSIVEKDRAGLIAFLVNYSSTCRESSIRDLDDLVAVGENYYESHLYEPRFFLTLGIQLVLRIHPNNVERILKQKAVNAPVGALRHLELPRSQIPQLLVEILESGFLTRSAKSIGWILSAGDRFAVNSRIVKWQTSRSPFNETAHVAIAAEIGREVFSRSVEMPKRHPQSIVLRGLFDRGNPPLYFLLDPARA